MLDLTVHCNDITVSKGEIHMTIKEFAKLCGCNPQTLRYYDQENLLKPVKVDEWSGYRYYDEEQALAFVKIKNLQKAGFKIDEIKALLDKDNRAIYEAFESKIKEEEQRLQEIKEAAPWAFTIGSASRGSTGRSGAITCTLSAPPRPRNSRRRSATVPLAPDEANPSR